MASTQTALPILNRTVNHSSGSGHGNGNGNPHTHTTTTTTHLLQAHHAPSSLPAPARLPRRPSVPSRPLAVTSTSTPNPPKTAATAATSAATATSASSTPPIPTYSPPTIPDLALGDSMQAATQLSPPRRPSLSSQRRPSAAMSSSAAQAARRPSRSPHPPPSRSTSISTAATSTYDPDRASDPMSYRSVSGSGRAPSGSIGSGSQLPYQQQQRPQQQQHMSSTKTNSSGSLQQQQQRMTRPSNSHAYPPRRLRSQYPRGATENHVEYILVASFDIDRGPIMEHQYPVAITGDENMLAELMLPDQAHARNQDWTIFFLHKDTSQEEEDEARQAKEDRRRRRRMRRDRAAGLPVEEDEDRERRRQRGGEDGDDYDDDADDSSDDDDDDSDSDSTTDSEPEGGEGPPLVYVLNLVNTKHDKSVKRGAIVKAMAICTRHPFLHIYKPLLLLALEEYFRSPVPETLAMLYTAVNAMDLSLMPKLSLLERHLLLASDNKDLFVEKFVQMIQMRMAEDNSQDRQLQPHEIYRPDTAATEMPPRRPGISRAGTKAHFEGQSAYSIPRDTHEFETKVLYKGIPIPIKVPVAVMPETVGDFSLIKLIQNFSEPHAKSPQPYQLHAHLTTNGPQTHPIIVLVNALLTQKRIIFLGHNMPSGEVAEAVLAACALASGGILRGFTRHAFPYTDLTKIDDLLNVPGFIAGVTNPTFEMHPEWWDVLCDLPSGRVRISNRIEPALVTEGLLYFQQQNPGYVGLIPGPPMGAMPSSSSSSSSSSSNNNDLTGDQAFLQEVLRSIQARHGERVIRAKWRDWVTKFTRIAAAFEENVYGASALYRGGAELESNTSGVCGHGYVWCDEAAKQKELAGNVTRIEGWRNTRSYYSAVQDLAQLFTIRPLKGLDLHHMHDRLRTQRLNPLQSREIYMALAKHVHSYDEVCLLLTVAPESHAGLFYVALGLFHKDREVRVRTVELLERIGEHEAGMHWFKALSRFEKLAYVRIRREMDADARARVEKEREREREREKERVSGEQQQQYQQQYQQQQQGGSSRQSEDRRRS